MRLGKCVAAALVAMAPMCATDTTDAQQVQAQRLSNGLLVLTVSSAGRDLSTTAAYFVGHHDEPDELRGIAHLLEHLAMRETRSGLSIATQLQRLGFSLGATTSADITSFGVSAPATESALREIVRIERLRMTELVLDSAAIEAERRRVAIESSSSAADTAERNGRSDRTSSHTGLERIRRTDLRAFYSQYYDPANAVLVVVSPLPANVVFAIARAELDTVRSRNVRERPGARRAQPGGRPTSVTTINASALIACEAAGDWRYCVNDAESGQQKPRPSAGPLPVWAQPEATTIEWRSDGARLRWAAQTGGFADSVYFALQIHIDPDSLSPLRIAALEVAARVLQSLSAGNRSLRDTLTAPGAVVTVASLPYPPLATSDRFRLLNALPTPIGVVGLQVVGNVARQAAPQLVRLFMTDASQLLDTAAVTAEIRNQQQLLAESSSFDAPRLEIAFRRSYPLSGSAGYGWRPETMENQIAVMKTLTADTVAATLLHVRQRGRMTLAILGADDNEVARWLPAEQSHASDGNRVTTAPHSCLSTPDTAVVTSTSPRTSVYFSICIPHDSSFAPSALAVMNSLLGGREDALLAHKLRAETGLVYDFESRMVPVPTAGATLWYLKVGARREDVDTVLAEVTQVLSNAATHGVPAARIEEFRDWLAARYANAALDGRRWTTQLASTGLTVAQLADQTRAVTPSDVLAALRHMSPDRLRVTVSRSAR